MWRPRIFFPVFYIPFWYQFTWIVDFFLFWNTDVNILRYSWFFFLLYINSFILNFKAWYDMIWWLPADKTYMHKTYEDSSQFGSDVLLVLICCCFNVYTCRLCLVLIHSSMCMYVCLVHYPINVFGCLCVMMMMMMVQ